MGGGIYQIDFSRDHSLKKIADNTVGPCPRNCNQEFQKERVNGYIYSNYNLRSNINATFGLSYENFSNNPRDSDKASDFDKINPKFGLQWDVIDNVRLRIVWIETVKSPLVASQTIEPTQVAGFNQFFDDLNGTRSRRMGLGIDTHFAKTIYWGGEISRRDLSVPILSGTTNEQKENLYRTYLYWPMSNQWVLRGEAQFEQFSRAKLSTEPHQIDTISAPISISYFGTQGLFSSLIGTYVNQKIDRDIPTKIYEGSSRYNEGKEGFFLVDTVLGFRLPRRRGALSVEARNIFDQEFLYRDTSFNAVSIININPSVVNRFIPDRIIMMRLTLHF